ncbi:MAG TPA: LEA type 2 family protein [Steroidobacteraceae bacterium]|nr:LEA type 2 family protein [Steroidobacteraceae bacterium]
MKFIVALMVALLGACASQTKLEAPNLSVLSMEMLESSLFTQRLKVRVRVQNPNDRELPVKGVSAKLEIAGEELASGVSANSFVVPAFGESEFDLLVDASMARTVLAMLGKSKESNPMESLDYRLTGKVSLSSGFVRSIPFDESGSLNLKQDAQNLKQDAQP